MIGVLILVAAVILTSGPSRNSSTPTETSCPPLLSKHIYHLQRPFPPFLDTRLPLMPSFAAPVAYIPRVSGAYHNDGGSIPLSTS